MHGLGEIKKINRRLGNPYGECVGRNGAGTPWEVRWAERDGAPGPMTYHVVRAEDDIILASHPSLKLARRQVAALIKATFEKRIT